MTELETLLLHSLRALDTESREREQRLLLHLNALRDQLQISTAQTSALTQRSDALSRDLSNLARQLSVSEKRSEKLMQRVDQRSAYTRAMLALISP